MFGLYIKELIKMLIVVAILSAVGLYFFPNKIMLAICGVLVLGAFGAAGDAVKTAKTEESKNRLKESVNNLSNNENLNLENTELNKTNMTSKLPTKENNSIFDDIELD